MNENRLRPPAQSPGAIDLALREYATDRQWEYLEAWVRSQSYTAAGTLLGVSDETVRVAVRAIYRKAGTRGYAPDYGLNRPTPPGMASRGVSELLDGSGSVQQAWHKTKPEGRDPADVVALPDPKIISKLATLYDAEGRVQQQWVSEKPSEAARLVLW